MNTLASFTPSEREQYVRATLGSYELFIQGKYTI